MTAYYHYSRDGRNTMSYDDGKYAFGVDDFGWDLTPPPEDFGYVLGWAALGETLGDDDRFSCKPPKDLKQKLKAGKL